MIYFFDFVCIDVVLIDVILVNVESLKQCISQKTI